MVSVDPRASVMHVEKQMKQIRKWWEEKTLRCFNAKLLGTASHCYMLKSNSTLA